MFMSKMLYNSPKSIFNFNICTGLNDRLISRNPVMTSDHQNLFSPLTFPLSLTLSPLHYPYKYGPLN